MKILRERQTFYSKECRLAICKRTSLPFKMKADRLDWYVRFPRYKRNFIIHNRACTEIARKRFIRLNRIRK